MVSLSQVLVKYLPSIFFSGGVEVGHLHNDPWMSYGLLIPLFISDPRYTILKTIVTGSQDNRNWCHSIVVLTN